MPLYIIVCFEAFYRPEEQWLGNRLYHNVSVHGVANLVMGCVYEFESPEVSVSEMEGELAIN